MRTSILSFFKKITIIIIIIYLFIVEKGQVWGGGGGGPISNFPNVPLEGVVLVACGHILFSGFSGSATEILTENI